MRLHTNLPEGAVRGALRKAKADGRVAADVQFGDWAEHGSRSHPRAFEIHLGTADKDSLPDGYRDQRGHRLSVRRPSADVTTLRYGATYHEWGWFIAEVFRLDPDAVFGPYKGFGDFWAKTDGEFEMGEE